MGWVGTRGIGLGMLVEGKIGNELRVIVCIPAYAGNGGGRGGGDEGQEVFVGGGKDCSLLMRLQRVELLTGDRIGSAREADESRRYYNPIYSNFFQGSDIYWLT